MDKLKTLSLLAVSSVSVCNPGRIVALILDFQILDLRML